MAAPDRVGIMDESQLRSIALFASLSRGQRREVAQRADEVQIPEGTALVREGEFAYEFFVIEEGSAEVLRNGEHVADLGPGDFMGEMGIVGQAKRNASVVARSPMRAIVMSAQDFRGMSQTYPEVAEQIGEAVGERSRTLVG
jgi:CRP/FNR family cyclic AMP-dependent transcriptional regulator